ncbi:MAG: endo-1,4-beta-xylanase [Sphingomicrobium sp.]
MRFGSAVAWSAPGADAGSFANPDYAALLERDCNVLVPENELKWEAIRPSATSFDFTRADAMLAYAESKGIAMRGHTLLWYVQERFPGWLRSYDFGSSPRASAEALVRDHVRTVTRRYAGKIMSWDVINEAVDNGTGQLRGNALSNAVGNDTSLLDLAFRTAREELPTAELVYNDFMDWGGGAAHRDGVLALLRGFRDRNVPVDTLGIQSHIGFFSAQPATDIVAARTPVMRAFLDQVVALGYKLAITEFDVNDRDRIGTIQQRDTDVATLARGWLDLLFSYPQLRDVLVWGMSDRYSWLQSFSPRPDGLPLRPLPYNRDFQAKLLRDTLIDAFNATSTRPA